MKPQLITLLGLAALLAAAPLAARTWTSAEGGRTFEGEFKSYDAAAGKVSVLRPDGTVMVFAEDKLSAADREWLKAQPAAEAANPAAKPAAAGDVAARLAAQKIGKNLARALHKLEGRSFKRFQLQKAPEFYLVYFSASW
jgi:hypothetical protein